MHAFFSHAITRRAALSSVAPVIAITGASCVLAALGARARETGQHHRKGHKLRLTDAVEALLAFAAALLSLRLAGDLARRYRATRAPQLAAWAASLLAYAIASGALAWGAAAGWDDRAFRVYYLAGGLLTAPLLGAGSLLLRGHRWAAPTAFVYAGLAIGIAVAVPLTAAAEGTAIPEAQAHLDFFPARLAAVLGNSLGTVAVVGVALLTLRARPLGNGLIIAGVLVAAVGSALAGLGTAATSAFVAVGALLLYAGFLAASGERIAATRSCRRGLRRAGRTA
jgi:hypothetical protein